MIQAALMISDWFMAVSVPIFVPFVRPCSRVPRGLVRFLPVRRVANPFVPVGKVNGWEKGCAVPLSYHAGRALSPCAATGNDCWMTTETAHVVGPK
jgi:hypothetical protein